MFTTRGINKHDTIRINPLAAPASTQHSNTGPSNTTTNGPFSNRSVCPGTENPPHPSEIPSTPSITSMLGNTLHTDEQFGSSSAGSFMRLIQAAVKGGNTSGFSVPPMQQDMARVAEHTLDDEPFCYIHCQPAPMMPPAKGIADHLVRTYWECEWSLYPIVDRPKVETVDSHCGYRMARWLS